MIAFANQEGIDAVKLLGPKGLAARHFAEYEYRPQQVQMAVKVCAAMREKYVLAVEAGTGVGKSFAYLAGAIDQALRKTGRVLISTYTIHLQQQLIEKDIPLLKQIVPQPFTACLAKGRNQYLCLRRLHYARSRQRMLFEDTGQLSRILVWANRTEDGSLSDLGFIPEPAVWQAVQSEHGVCLGRKCSAFRECFYWKARRKLESADLIVANHALLFSDLVLKQSGGGVMPEYRFVILDEAHNLEHVAEDHFGITLSRYGIGFLLNTLYHPRQRRGLLGEEETHRAARNWVGKCRRQLQLFFAQAAAWYAHAAEETGGRCGPDFVSDNLSQPVRQLRLELGRVAKQTENKDEQYELLRMVDRFQQIEEDLKTFLSQSRSGFVYWVEGQSNHREKVILRSAPLHVGPYVRQRLLDQYESVILTSATLSCGPAAEGGFDFFAQRIGLEHYQVLQVDSPFDYAHQVRLFIESRMPDPNAPEFTECAIAAICKYLLKTEGRAFVLFTSYSMLRDFAARMEPWISQHRMTLLVQGGSLDRASMLTQFKDLQRCVLFGTDSFWQGVDVPGERLSNVIIVRLPFAVPNHPLIQGRIEQMKEEGLNPFYSYQVPMAVLKFKQGFGRLIRRKTDSGIVAVLDSRIIHKSYGSQFLQSIPECPVILDDSADFG